MRYGKQTFLAAAFLLAPALAWAGTQPVELAPAPALGETGLIALGVGLVGLGLSFLRKR